MKNSYNELFKQFCAAKGIDRIQGSFEDFKREFLGWIGERKDIGAQYMYIINNFNLFSNNNTFAEVNKSIEDSITLPFYTKLITPYIDESFIDYPERIIEGHFYVNKSRVVSIVSSPEVMMKILSKEEIKTYMIQNPYDFNTIDGWDVLHNSGRNSIIVGVYGNYLDNDRQEKIDRLLQFKNKLKGNYKEINYVLNDRYFYLLASVNQKTRQRHK